MPIENIKQSFGQGGMKARPERAAPPPKEAPKDTSVFGGRPGMGAGAFKYSLDDGRLFNTTGGLTREQRVKMAEKLWPGKSDFEKSDLGKAKSQLDLGAQGEYRGFSEQEKIEARKLIKGLENFSGK